MEFNGLRDYVLYFRGRTTAVWLLNFQNGRQSKFLGTATL